MKLKQEKEIVQNEHSIHVSMVTTPTHKTYKKIKQTESHSNENWTVTTQFCYKTNFTWSKNCKTF